MQCPGRRVVRDEEQERTLKRLERAILDIGHAKRVLIRLGLGDVRMPAL
jgi:hypothetical protein